MRNILTVGISGSFEAAHKLNVETPYNKKCTESLHGHHFKYTIYLQGKIKADTGMVIDFGEVKELIIKELEFLYDHKNLNNIFFNPTAEILILSIVNRVENLIDFNNLDITLTKVELSETENNKVIWERS